MPQRRGLGRKPGPGHPGCGQRRRGPGSLGKGHHQASRPAHAPRRHEPACPGRCRCLRRLPGNLRRRRREERTQSATCRIQRLNRTEFAASVKELHRRGHRSEAGPAHRGRGRRIQQHRRRPGRVALLHGAVPVGGAPRRAARRGRTACRRWPRSPFRPRRQRGRLSRWARAAARSRGGIRFTHVFPADGEYHFNVPEEDFIDMGLYPRGAADRGHAGHPDRRRGNGAQGNRRHRNSWTSPTATARRAARPSSPRSRARRRSRRAGTKW